MNCEVFAVMQKHEEYCRGWLYEIPLTRRLSTLVDKEDFERFSENKWIAHKGSRKGSPFYAARGVSHNGVRKISLMHREILGLTFGDKLQVDHINHNTLDNRRQNLRVVTNSQNQMNMRGRSTNKSGYKGVTFDRERNKWFSCIRVNRKTIALGRYSTPELAYSAYCEAARKHFGEYAYLREVSI